MHITSSEEINFYQKCLNLGKRIDGRQHNQMRAFELTKGSQVIMTSNGSSRLYLPEENLTLLVGVKADIISLEETPDSSLIQLSIASSMAQVQNMVQKEQLAKTISEIEYYFQNIYDRSIGTKKLILVEGKLAWKIYIDVYVNGFFSYSCVDHLSYSIRAALDSCSLPELDINLNVVSNEYTFTPKETVYNPFEGLVREDSPENKDTGAAGSKTGSPQTLPHLLVCGYNKQQTFFDLSPQESLAVESVLLASIDAEGQVEELQTIDGAEVKIDCIALVINEIRRYAKALYSYKQFIIQTDEQK